VNAKLFAARRKFTLFARETRATSKGKDNAVLKFKMQSSKFRIPLF
jgi:hypothetical protein